MLQGLLKKLVVHQPEDPLEYLIEQLELSDKQRWHVFVMGAPGSNRKDLARKLAEHFEWSFISLSDCLNDEVDKKTDVGKIISKMRKSYTYIDDQIVIDVIKKQISLAEQEGRSWVIEGFPRTDIQAAAL